MNETYEILSVYFRRRVKGVVILTSLSAGISNVYFSTFTFVNLFTFKDEFTFGSTNSQYNRHDVNEIKNYDIG